MATIVFFHAHPDDEAIATGRHHGQAGRRRATGWCWSPPPAASSARSPRACWPRASRWPSAGGSSSTRPAGSSGSPRQVYLDYLDSGMAGEATNHRPAASPPPTSARRRRRWPPSSTRSPPTCWSPTTSTEATATPTTSRCTGWAWPRPTGPAPPVVYMATMNRDFMVRTWPTGSSDADWEPPEGSTDGMEAMGEPASRLTTEVDVIPWIDRSARPCGPTPARSPRTASSWPCPTTCSPWCGDASGTSGSGPARTPGPSTGNRPGARCGTPPTAGPPVGGRRTGATGVTADPPGPPGPRRTAGGGRAPPRAGAGPRCRRRRGLRPGQLVHGRRQRLPGPPAPDSEPRPMPAIGRTGSAA